MSVHKIADNAAKVKDALAVWAEWLERDNQHDALGYGKCVGFNGAGGTRSWEEFESRVEANMAVNVQAIYDGLKHPQQLAIDYFHLAAVIKPQRYCLEDCYSEALMVIEIALRRRGLL